MVIDGRFYPTICAWYTSKISMLCLDPTFLCSKSILFYNNFAHLGFLHHCSKTQLPSQNVSLRSWEWIVPTYQPPTLEHSFFFQWGLLVAISNVANVKFELQRPLNPEYSFQLRHVAKLVIVHLAKFGYRPGMKVENLRNPFIFLLPWYQHTVWCWVYPRPHISTAYLPLYNILFSTLNLFATTIHKAPFALKLLES
jgi:hypothetical protein